MIFMAKVCPKAINFAIAESIHQLLVVRPHPNLHAIYHTIPNHPIPCIISSHIISHIKMSSPHNIFPVPHLLLHPLLHITNNTVVLFSYQAGCPIHYHTCSASQITVSSYHMFYMKQGGPSTISQITVNSYHLVILNLQSPTTSLSVKVAPSTVPQWTPNPQAYRGA